MNLAVQLYSAIANPLGVPGVWPSAVVELGDSTDLPDNTYQLMTQADYLTYVATYQAVYDAWYLTYLAILPAYKPPTQSVAVVSTPAIPINPDSVPIVEAALRRGTPGFTNFTIVSHDFSDRTSWYQKSVPVTNETLTDNGDGLLFNSAHPHWINMNSPKLTLDYKKVLERDGSLTNSSLRYVVVKSNGTTLVEGTDYTVNYPLGKVTFAGSQSGNTLTANYYHNNGIASCSEFLFTPAPGTQYRIEHIESQFSVNTDFTDAVVVEIWAGAVTYSGGVYSVNLAGYGGFAGVYFDAGYGQSRSIYRNMADLVNWCNNEYPPIPPCGSLQNAILVFPFLYVGHPAISVKQGVTIRLKTKNDTEVSAEICTVTLYMEKGPA